MTEQPPSAWQIEQALATVRQAIDNVMETEHLTGRNDAMRDDEDVWAMAELNKNGLEARSPARPDVNVIMRRLLLAAEEAEADADACKKREADLRTRRERFERHKSIWRTAALQIMQLLPEAFPDGKFRDALVSATIRTGKPGVIVTDIDALDERFVQTERKPRLREIAQALDDGEVVAGVERRNAAPFIVIKSS